MSAAVLLAEIQQLGVCLEARGATLHAEAPEDILTPELVAKLKAHKAELLTALEKSTAAAVITTCEGVTNPKINTGLHPYHYRLKNDKGGGTYLTPAATLEEARAELLRRWPDELLMVTRGG